MESISASGTGLAQVLEEQGRRTGWVADQLGVTPSAVSRWASGEWPIPERRVRELAVLLGVQEFQIRNSVPATQENAPQPGAGQALPSSQPAADVQGDGDGTRSESAPEARNRRSRKAVA